jgi:dihydroflavonol-4-reductase
MNVFLTGATGFVGHHVARALAGEGANLRLLVRKTSNLEKSGRHPRRTRRRRSARTGIHCSRAFRSPACDAVMHVAADYRLWIRDPKAMYRANVDGTRELLRMAREAGVKRVVYTSSVATMHFRRDGLVINEDTPVSLKDMVGHYKRSKFLAEQEAIKPPGRPAGHDSEPHHADRAQRRKAHAHRPHLRRLSERQISGLHGHRPQPGGRDGGGANARCSR